MQVKTFFALAPVATVGHIKGPLRYISYFTKDIQVSSTGDGIFLVENCGISDIHVDGLAQDCSNSSALALELPQSWAKPSVFCIP